MAQRRPPAVYVPADTPGGRPEAYVRLPLAPEVVAALQEHAANASRLFDLITGTDAAAAEVVAQIAKTGAALQRDLVKVRARVKKR